MTENLDDAAAPNRSYWLAPSTTGSSERARSLLEALRMYRAAEQAMRRRTRESMSMGETDLLLLRYVLKARDEQRPVTPTDAKRYLGVTTASVTALLQRLEKSGHLTRTPNPRDGRSFFIAVSDHAEREVKETLGRMHERMYDVASHVDADDAATIIRFLTEMKGAVDTIALPAPENGGHPGA